VPTVPGTPGPVADAPTAEAAAARHRLPLILKAAGAAAGSAWRACDGARELAAAFATATRRAQSAFGNAARLLERYLERPRTSRCRCSPTRTAASCTCTSASARSSAAPEARRGVAGAGLDPRDQARLTEARGAGAAPSATSTPGTMEFLVDAAGASTSWR
jgi:hypothetical protein